MLLEKFFFLNSKCSIARNSNVHFLTEHLNFVSILRIWEIRKDEIAYCWAQKDIDVYIDNWSNLIKKHTQLHHYTWLCMRNIIACFFVSRILLCYKDTFVLKECSARPDHLLAPCLHYAVGVTSMPRAPVIITFH